MRKFVGMVLGLGCALLFADTARAQGTIPHPTLPGDHKVMAGKAACTASPRLDPRSQNPCDWFLLAIAYQQGSGVPQDHARSLDYLERAARANHASAQYGLGEASEAGFGGRAPNKAAAFHWTLIAAQQRHPQASEMVGLYLLEGTGVPADPGQAAYWFQQAYELGQSTAATNLGLLYFEGRGVPRDPAKAVQFWTWAAEDGVATSQALLGDAYRMGEGVPFDIQKARYWLGRARAGGSKYAVKVLAYIDEVDRRYANVRTSTAAMARRSPSGGSSGPSISDQVMETHRRQARENCAAAMKGANRLCVLP